MSSLKQCVSIFQNILNTCIFWIITYTRDLKQMAHYLFYVGLALSLFQLLNIAQFNFKDFY